MSLTPSGGSVLLVLEQHMDHYSRTKAIADQLILMANGTPLPGKYWGHLLTANMHVHCCLHETHEQFLLLAGMSPRPSFLLKDTSPGPWIFTILSTYIEQGYSLENIRPSLCPHVAHGLVGRHLG